MLVECQHHVLEVDEFHSLGCTVSCVLCEEITFDLTANQMHEIYFPFTHTSPAGADQDIQVLIHQDLIGE